MWGGLVGWIFFFFFKFIIIKILKNFLKKKKKKDIDIYLFWYSIILFIKNCRLLLDIF